MQGFRTDAQYVNVALWGGGKELLVSVYVRN